MFLREHITYAYIQRSYSHTLVMGISILKVFTLLSLTIARSAILLSVQYCSLLIWHLPWKMKMKK